MMRHGRIEKRRMSRAELTRFQEPNKSTSKLQLHDISTAEQPRRSKNNILVYSKL